MADLLGMALVFRSSWITARAVTQIIKARSDLGKYVHNLILSTFVLRELSSCAP